MTPTLLNPAGVFPDVAIPADGRPVVAFRISGSNLLRVMFLDAEGQPTGAQEDIDCAMGDSTFARMIVALGRTWLAYRAFRGGLEQAVVREVLPLSLGPERVLGPTFGNNPVCLSAEGLVAWQDHTAGVVQGLRLNDGETLILRHEMRPTGLSHLDGDHPVFSDDNRPTEPAMWNPVRAGAVIVGEGRGDAEGLVAKAEGRTGIVLPGACLNPRCADFGESTYATVTWTPSVGVRFMKFTPNDIVDAPPPVKPKPIPLDQVEPLTGKWLVSYYEQNGNVPAGKLPPGNAMVAVRNQNNDDGPQPRPMIITAETEGKVTGKVIAYRIGSEAQFVGEVVTIEVMEARARAVFERGYRPWFYWDEPTTPRPPVLPAGSVIEVFGFCGKDESIADWERSRRQRLHEAASWPGNYLLAISAQTHNTNPALKPEPSVMIPPMVRLCVWARAEFGDRFLGPDIFNNSGRDFPDGSRGGLTANPQLVPHWTKVFSGVTGLPDVLGNGGGGGGNVLAIRLGPYAKTVSRSAPYGLDIPYDIDSDRPIVRLRFAMQDGSEAQEIERFKVAQGASGLYFRGFHFKPVINGTHRFVITIWDDQGNQASVTSEPVTVTSSGNGGGGPVTIKEYKEYFAQRWRELGIDRQTQAIADREGFANLEACEKLNRHNTAVATDPALWDQPRYDRIEAECKAFQCPALIRIAGELHHQQGHRDVGLNVKENGNRWEDPRIPRTIATDILAVKPSDDAGQVVAGNFHIIDTMFAVGTPFTRPDYGSHGENKDPTRPWIEPPQP